MKTPEGYGVNTNPYLLKKGILVNGVDQLSINRQAKKNKHEQAEHMRELQSLKQRMQKIGSKNDRKKNNTDPLSHPVWFFKGKNRTPANEKMLSLNNFEKKIKDKYHEEQEAY